MDVAGDAKVVTRKGEEYLEVNNIKTKIGIGSSEVRIASKDKDKDKNDELREYTYCLATLYQLTILLAVH